MESGLNTTKDIFELISYIVTSVSLIGILITYALSKKQIHFSAMEKCINDFRQSEKLAPGNSPQETAKQYCELVNEELFYIENDYLPRVVVVEWIDGMIDYLPFILKDNSFKKSATLEAFKNIDETKKILKNHPRISAIIKLKAEINFELIFLDEMNEKSNLIRKNERDKLIYHMISNLNIGILTRLHYKRVIAIR